MSDVEPKTPKGEKRDDTPKAIAWLRNHLEIALPAAISSIALILVVIGLFVPGRINEWTVALLLVAALPWLMPLIDHLELPGGSKIKLRKAVEQTEAARDEAERGAEQALEQANLASAAAQDAKMRVTELEARLKVMEQKESKPGEPEAAPESDQAKTIQELARQYNEIREEEGASWSRTSKMTKVVQALMDATERVSGFDVAAALQNQANGGLRLAGYASLYRAPDPNLLATLVDAAIDVETTAFGQYWALRAIAQVVEAMGATPPDPAVVRRLRTWQGRIKSGTDRYYALTRILNDIDAGGAYQD